MKIQDHKSPYLDSSISFSDEDKNESQEPAEQNRPSQDFMTPVSEAVAALMGIPVSLTLQQGSDEKRVTF